MQNLIDILDAAEKVELIIEGRSYLIPKGHPLLRGFQYLELKDVNINVTAGPFCWNGDCQSCRCDMKVDGEFREQEYACQTIVEGPIEILKINENYDYDPDD